MITIRLASVAHREAGAWGRASIWNLKRRGIRVASQKGVQADRRIVAQEQLATVQAGVLNATVGVMQQCRLWPTLPQGHLQRFACLDIAQTLLCVY